MSINYNLAFRICESWDTLSRVREIEKVLRGQEIVKEFDEDLFTALVEQIQVKSLVEVVFVLKAGVEVREIL